MRNETPSYSSERAECDARGVQQSNQSTSLLSLLSCYIKLHAIHRHFDGALLGSNDVL